MDSRLWADKIHHNLEAGHARQPCDDPAIAAVVTRATHNVHTMRLGPAGAQVTKGRRAGTGHQGIACEASLIDADSIQGSGLLCGVKAGHHEGRSIPT